ncbi:dTDP-4-dehydrorhamnose reductase [candidate division KSB1 bacterium]
MEQILITGSNGQLGKSFERISKDYPNYNLIYTDIEELDITDKNAIKNCLSDISIKIIINCAAYTAVDKAEEDHDQAMKINATAAGYLAQIAADKNIPLVHISTDYVFNGKNYLPYNETDPTNPDSKYGHSKLAGEKEIIKYANKAVIIRTSWLYSEFGHNFLKTMLKYGKEREELRVVYDQIGSPTYARDLAHTIFEILPKIMDQSNKIEIYHYGNEGAISWYDFAKAIMEISGTTCNVFPIETKDYPLPAARPHYSVLNKKKIKDTFGLEIPYWKDSLIDCINNLK